MESDTPYHLVTNLENLSILFLMYFQVSFASSTNSGVGAMAGKSGENGSVEEEGCVCLSQVEQEIVVSKVINVPLPTAKRALFAKPAKNRLIGSAIPLVC
jgi:hypothetical protein